MKRLALPLLAATPFLSALVPHADGAAIMSHTPSFNPRQFRAGLVKRRFNYGVASPVTPAAATATPALDPLLGGTLQIASRPAADAGVANLDDGIIRSRDGTLLVPGTSSAAGLIVVNQTVGGTLQINSGVTIDAGLVKSGAGTLSLGTVNRNSGVLVVNSVLSGNESPVMDNGTYLTLGTLEINSGRLDGVSQTSTIGDANTGSIFTLAPNVSPLVTSSGTLTINAGNYFSVSQTLGSLTIGDGAVVSIGSVVPPVPLAAEPVPEPGSALLLALGTLAVSMVRRRTV